MEMARTAALALPACPYAAPGAAKSKVRAPVGSWGGQVLVPGPVLSARSGFVAKFPAVGAQLSDGVDAALLEVGDTEAARVSKGDNIFLFDLLEYESQHGPVSLIPRDDKQNQSVELLEDGTIGSVLEETAIVDDESAAQTTSEVSLPYEGGDSVDLAEETSAAQDAIDLAPGIAEVEPAVQSIAGRDDDSLSTSSLDVSASLEPAVLAAPVDSIPTDVEHAEDYASLETEGGDPTETGIAELDRVTVNQPVPEDVVPLEEEKAVAVNPDTGLTVHEEFIAVRDDVVGDPLQRESTSLEVTSLESPGDVASTLSPLDGEAEVKLGQPTDLFLEPLGGDERDIISVSLVDEDEVSTAELKDPAEGTSIEELLESSAAVTSATQEEIETGEAIEEIGIISSSGEDDAAAVGQEAESAIQELDVEGADKVTVAEGEGEGEEPIENQISVAESPSTLQVQVEQDQALAAEGLPLDIAGRYAEEESAAIQGVDATSPTQTAELRLDAANEDTPTEETNELEDEGVLGEVVPEIPPSEFTSFFALEEPSSEDPNGEQENRAMSVNHVNKEITASLYVGPSATTVETDDKQQEAILGVADSDVSSLEATSDSSNEPLAVTEAQEEVAAELSQVPESVTQSAEGEGQEGAEESQGIVNPCKVYVAGLPFERTSKELRDELTELFGRYGSVKDLQVVPYRTKGGKEIKGRHRGIAFVEMESDDEVKAAIEGLNAKPNFGRILMVRAAVIGKPPKEVQSPAGYQLYIGNLDKAVTKETLLDVFRSYGNVVATKVIKDFNTGESRGFGFVTYATEVEAKQAVGALNGSEVAGSAIRVSMS